MKVLLVEENLFLVPAVQTSLERGGHAVVVSTDEERARSALREGAECVLVSFGATRLDPDAFCRALRAEAGDEVTILGYGPHVDASLSERAREAGCDAFVPNGQVAKNAARLVERWRER